MKLEGGQCYQSSCGGNRILKAWGGVFRKGYDKP